MSKQEKKKKVEKPPAEAIPDFEKLAREARVERGKQAGKEIDAVCKKYNVKILPMITLIGTQIAQAGIQIVAL